MINLIILYSDIIYRTVKNWHIILLILFYPIWHITFSDTYTHPPYVSYIVIGILLIYGTISYQINQSLGAGDIKYISTLLLFLGTHSLSTFIGNIGVFTILILCMWYFMIVGQIFGLRKHINIQEIRTSISTLSIKKIIIHLISFMSDWILIGFFIKSIFDIFSVQLFQVIPTDAELYFIVSMLVFLIRPSIKYLLTKWKYKIFPILGMLLYFLFYIQEYTFIVFVGDIGYFIQNIWIYFVIFTSVIYITQYTFRVYDKIIGSIGYISKVNTIPYSIIIFMGFVSVYFFDLNLISLLREIYFPRI